MAGSSFREIRSGGSFLSQSDLRVSFGLGDRTGAVDVECGCQAGGAGDGGGSPRTSCTRLSSRSRPPFPKLAAGNEPAQRASRTTGRPLSCRGVRCGFGRNRTHRRGTEGTAGYLSPQTGGAGNTATVSATPRAGNDAFPAERQAKEIEGRLHAAGLTSREPRLARRA